MYKVIIIIKKNLTDESIILLTAVKQFKRARLHDVYKYSYMLITNF